MTSRRGTLIEDGARELLQSHGYTVRVIPSGFNKRLPPAHLVASRGPDETRYIKIRKISHLSLTVDLVQEKYHLDIVQFRKHLARNAGETGIRCEIWIYSLYRLSAWLSMGDDGSQRWSIRDKIDPLFEQEDRSVRKRATEARRLAGNVMGEKVG